MRSTLFRLRREIRAGWRAWAVLAVLIGAFGGVVVGVAAGARRTDTAYPRFLEASNASHAFVAAAQRTGLDGYYRELAQLPGVEDLGVMVGLPFDRNVVAVLDAELGRTFDRPRLLAGRLPRLDQPREALVNEAAAVQEGVRVGSVIEMVASQSDPDDATRESVREVPVSVTVVGIGRWANEVVPTARFDSEPLIWMTPATYTSYAEGYGLAFDGAFVRLGDPSALAGFRAAAERLGAARGGILFADNVDRDRRVQRAIRPQVAALGVFAALAGLSTFLVLGQAVARQLSEDATEVPILRALGMSRGQVVGLALGRTAIVAAAGALLAVGVAMALSPIFPVGVARRAELGSGLDVNFAFLGLGALAIVVLFVARAAVPAWRLAAAPAGPQGTAELGSPERTSGLARAVSAAGAPPPAVAGVRMALEPGRGRSAVAVRPTLVGAVVGLAAVGAALTFAANMDRLATTPSLYGRAWDVTLDGSFGAIDRAGAEEILRSTPAVAGWSRGYYGEASIAGRALTAIGLDGEALPSVVEGRRPRTDDEVVLGTSTLDHARRRVGDTVEVAVGDGTRQMRVVGRAVFPALGRGSFPQTGLGEGMLATAAALKPPPDPSVSEPYFNFYLVDLRAGTSATEEAELGRRLAELCPPDQTCELLGRGAVRERPAEIENLDRIRWTPVVLAGVLAALAVATVGNTLVSSVRRRRRDLAILKTIGFERRQVSAVVAWQATTFAAVAAVIGLPLGLVSGRLAWRALSDQLGIVPDVATPVLAVLLAGPATVLVAVVMALVPGWLAGRVRPAVALRTE